MLLPTVGASKCSQPFLSSQDVKDLGEQVLRKEGRGKAKDMIPSGGGCQSLLAAHCRFFSPGSAACGDGGMWRCLPGPRAELPVSVDSHVHGHHAPGGGASGPELSSATGCGVHRLCGQAPRTRGTEGLPHVRVRKEVRGS